jgi:hypothetical protein
VIVWADRDALLREVATPPENWLVRFAREQPNDVRKLTEAVNGKILYRTAAVLDAIEQGKYIREGK